MTDIVLELTRAAVALAILVFLIWSGRRQQLWDERGWPIIVAGFALLTLGSVVDVTDNFEHLNTFVVVGDTPQQAFVEKVIGFLGGFVLLSIGFWHWLPLVGAVRQARRDLESTNLRLESLVEQRSADLLQANHALEAEVAIRRRAEQQLAQQVTHLQHARDNALAAVEAKSLFFANMSHELRSPLTGVIGMSAQLEKETFGPLNDKQREYMSHILQSGGHLLALIDDLLDLAKVDSGTEDLDLEPVSVAAIAADSLTLVRETAVAKGVSLVADARDDLPRVMGDERRLKQVFVNLLSNAINFTPAGGSVGVELEALDNKIQVTVWDTGKGIAPDDLTRIFQPFEQAHTTAAHSGGTGLGLALAERLVAAHGGGITVESTQGVGSRFTVTLQRSDVPLMVIAEDLSTSPASQNDLSHNTERVRVLVAEDDETSRILISDALLEAGFDVIIAADGREAVELATTFCPHVLLIDVRMPVMGGLEATRLLKAAQPTCDVAVIALTAQAMPGDDDLCYEAGCDAYLTKPMDIDEMIRVVQSFGPAPQEVVGRLAG